MAVKDSFHRKSEEVVAIERRGIFVGSEGVFDVPKDSASERQKLESLRDSEADRVFETEDLPEIAATDSGWTRDGVFWSKGVYWENLEGDSIRGSFGVEFRPDTAEVAEKWVNY